MKKVIVFLLLVLSCPLAGVGQSPAIPAPPPRTYFSAALNFQAFGLPGGMPVQELLRQPGVELVLGRGLNKKNSLLAGLHLGWLSSRYNGNTYYAAGNLAYAPALWGNLRGSVHAGAGAALNSSPSAAWENSDSGWQQSRNSKASPFVGLGLGLQYRLPLNKGYLAPMLRYQVLIEGNYNESIPLLPVSMIQVGTQFGF